MALGECATPVAARHGGGPPRGHVGSRGGRVRVGATRPGSTGSWPARKRPSSARSRCALRWPACWPRSQRSCFSEAAPPPSLSWARWRCCDLAVAHHDLNPTAPVALFTHRPAAARNRTRSGRRPSLHVRLPRARGEPAVPGPRACPTSWPARRSDGTFERRRRSRCARPSSRHRPPPGESKGATTATCPAWSPRRSRSSRRPSGGRSRPKRACACCASARSAASPRCTKAPVAGLRPLGRYEGYFVDPVLSFEVPASLPASLRRGARTCRGHDPAALRHARLGGLRSQRGSDPHARCRRCAAGVVRREERPARAPGGPPARSTSRRARPAGRWSSTPGTRVGMRVSTGARPSSSGPTSPSAPWRCRPDGTRWSSCSVPPRWPRPCGPRPPAWPPSWPPPRSRARPGRSRAREPGTAARSIGRIWNAKPVLARRLRRLVSRAALAGEAGPSACWRSAPAPACSREWARAHRAGPALDRDGPAARPLERPGGRRVGAAAAAGIGRPRRGSSTCCTTSPGRETFSRKRRESRRPVGRIALMEPWVTPVSYPIYRFVHQEGCTLGIDPWDPFGAAAGKDAFEGDGALPWRIVRSTSEAEWRRPGVRASARRHLQRLRLPVDPRVPPRVAAAESGGGGLRSGSTARSAGFRAGPGCARCSSGSERASGGRTRPGGSDRARPARCPQPCRLARRAG